MGERRLSGGRPRPATGSVRLLRIGVLTFASLALAVGAHAAGGGSLPAPGGLLLLATAVLLTASALTAVRLRAPALVAVVGLGQWFLHQALMSLAELGASAQTLSVHAHHGLMTMRPPGSSAVGSGIPGLSGGAGLSGLAGLSGVSGNSGTVMLLCHAAASVVTAWLLARGEATLWRVVSRVVAPRPGRRPRLRGVGVATVPARGLSWQWVTVGSPVARGPPLLPAGLLSPVPA